MDTNGVEWRTLVLAFVRSQGANCGMTRTRFALLAMTIAPLAVPAGRAAENPNPKTVAQEMATALRRNAASHPFAALLITLEKPEAEFLGVFFKKMMTAASEDVKGMPAAQLHFALRGYYVPKRPVSDAQRADYLARLDRMDKGVIIAFNPATSTNTGVDSLLAGALAFHDFLFEGPQWKQGNPGAALARWKTIPAEARSAWEQAAKDASTGDPSMAPWSLLAVDSLFQGDAFQLKLFQEALPLARELLGSPNR